MSRYLITFDMNTDCLANHYHGNNSNNAYYDIRKILEKYGFINIQGSVYLGNQQASEAHGTIAIQELTMRYAWFSTCISNLRFYRLESDLNAQFIIDGVCRAKQVFFDRLEVLKQNLIESGLSEIQINNILNKQKLTLEALDNIIPTLPSP